MSKGQMKHEIDITKFNIMAFASNVLSFQNGFVTVTDENLGKVHFSVSKSPPGGQKSPGVKFISEKAGKWIDALQAQGRTSLKGALAQSIIQFRHGFKNFALGRHNSLFSADAGGILNSDKVSQTNQK